MTQGTDQSSTSQTKVIVVAPNSARKESIQEVKAKVLIGEYKCGDGLGYNLRLILKEQGRFDCTWRGCLGEYGKSAGEWVVDRAGVKLIPASSEGLLKEKPLGRLHLIRFGEHYLLLPKDDYDWFEKNGPDTLCCLHKQAARDALEKERRRRFEEMLALVDNTKEAQQNITIDQALLWLPANTETILVAQGPFEIQAPKPPDPKNPESPPFDKLLQLFACGPVTHLEQGSFLKSLNGLTVALVLEGARGFRSPKGLGLMHYDGCHIMVFKDDLKTAGDDFTKALKASKAEEKQIGGHKTLLIQSKMEDDQWKFYFTIPKPNVILAATDQNYLEEVLKRMGMKEKPNDRALPETLPEWKHVDRKAKLWGLRHYDKGNAKNDPSTPLTNEKRAANTPDPKAVGLVFALDAGKKNTANIKYLSESDNARLIAGMGWVHEQEGLKPEIREKTKGVVEISLELSDERTKQIFFLVFLAALGHGIYI
jgi:hypothetical protein